MQRLCFTFQLYPGKLGEYRHRHDNIWPELVEDIKRAGISNYNLFALGDDRVVAYAECEPDASTCFERLKESDANRRWQTWFEDTIVSLTDESGSLNELPELWHLD